MVSRCLCSGSEKAAKCTLAFSTHAGNSMKLPAGLDTNAQNSSRTVSSACVGACDGGSLDGINSASEKPYEFIGISTLNLK